LARSDYQANIYVTSTDRAAFEAYAKQFLLDAAGLLALLFAREMRVGRLRMLISKDVAVSGRRKSKITAHLSVGDHGLVTALAQRHGRSLSEVGALLVKDELECQWLSLSISTRFES
jgi:hypothetical protein